MYDAYKTGEEIDDLKEEAFLAIEALQKEIDKAQDALYAMDGVVRCKECASVNEGDAEFCKKCGNRL